VELCDSASVNVPSTVCETSPRRATEVISRVVLLLPPDVESATTIPTMTTTATTPPITGPRPRGMRHAGIVAPLDVGTVLAEV
jgi:hypothetical protein